MVKICTPNYPKENEEIYKSDYEMFPFPLHDFQKWAIEAIVEKNHVLITAHTGSGKTLPAEFAIRHFHAKGLKTIYCSPIKSLSNQKFYDFGNKYPDISIGVITGDVKCNPDADVLIMTTEVLLNKLYQIYSTTPITQSSISFDMDIERELGCVVFDEVHYINDMHRGFVWENSLMMLPQHVQLVLLSATIDCPEKFAKWIENRVPHTNIRSNIPKKKVYLTTNSKRAVPLTHYSFITTPTGIYKAIKDKTLEQEIKSIVDKPIVIQNAQGEFNEPNYRKLTNTLRLFLEKKVYVRRPQVMNNLAKYMFENQMLPALCFLFSRKQIEACARELTTVILEDDSKIPYIIDRECENIMRKLPNYQEYLRLPEYISMVKLLRKGVGVHHSGILPPIREMIELLFLKGFIKILFCSETLSVGINMPVKTVVFTDVTKYDGNEQRILYAHEYTQMAGRAGRLGIDTVGHVIHLNNLFRKVDTLDYRKMMKGAPPTLTSKFKISFHLLLNLIGIGNNDFSKYTNKSMIINDITRDLQSIYNQTKKLNIYLEDNLHAYENMNTPVEFIEEYTMLKEECRVSQNKRRREIYDRIDQLEATYSNIVSDIQFYKTYQHTKDEKRKLEMQYEDTQNLLENNVRIILTILEKEGFICKGNVTNNEDASLNSVSNYELTPKGVLASNIKEVHCLVFANLIDNKMLDGLNAIQLAALFSCFTSIYVHEDFSNKEPICSDNSIISVVKRAAQEYEIYQDIEDRERIKTGTDYTIHYELIDYVIEWAKCTDYQQCDAVIVRLEKEKGIFLGEFIKALLKINNISSEMENLAESIQNIPLLRELSDIRHLTLKYVATNQSLYI
jgi:superfamily II RNA helicase